MTTRGHRRPTPAPTGRTLALVVVCAAGLLLGVLGAPAALAAPPPTPAPPPPHGPSGSAPPGAHPNPLVPHTQAAPPASTAPGQPGTPGAARPVSLPLLLPGLPPLLPALFPARPAKPPQPAKPPMPAKPPLPATPGLSAPAAQVVALTNAERARAGCGPLKVDSRLNRSAQRHSADMADRDYFEHEDPDGKDFADREADAGFSGDSGGENIAMGQTSAAEVMNDWMHSSGHRRNILDCSFTSIGVGYVSSGHYWTQNFGG